MYLLENLTWEQAKEAFANCKTAIIPIGSTEQHGPHLPLGTDFFTAQFYSDEMVKREANAIVTPVLPIGFADYHSCFPGTLSLTEETLQLVVTEICDKLVTYGITHILFMNCHGGNGPILNRVAYYLRKKGIVAATFMWFEMIGKIKQEWQLIGHGDASETCYVLAHKPGLVDLSKAKRPTEKKLPGQLKLVEVNHVEFKDVMTVHFAMRIDDVSDNGAIFEPTLYPGADKGQWMEGVTADMAYDMSSVVLDYLVEFLPDFEKINFPAVE